MAVSIGAILASTAIATTPTADATTAGATTSASVDAAPASATVVIPKGGQYKGYTPSTITVAKGGTLYVLNNDSMRHSVTSVDGNAAGAKLFAVDVNPGDTVQVPGVNQLAPGSYSFYCHYHPTMRGTLVVSGSGGGVTPAPQSFDQPLFIPPVLTKAHLRIPVEKAPVQILPTGPPTQMWTYGGTYPGPTIKRPAGHDTKVTFANHLPKVAGKITVHFHGDHHRAADDGQPTRHLVGRGHSRTYDYPLTDGGRPERAAFDFYHDHRMDRTGRNNWHGLQGMFLVTDGKARQLHLPRGKYDVPLMVSNRSFTADNQLTNPFPKHPQMVLTGPDAPPGDGTVGDRILVNGRFAPYLKVAAHRYRFRILNASNFTSYDFAFSDGRPFVQVGTGNGLLPKPVVRQDILLGPAQRADVVVDFHHALHQRIVLQSIPRTDGSAHGIGTPTAEIMQFRVTRTAADDTHVPAQLQTAPKITVPDKVSARWVFDVKGDQQTGSYWTVNGKPFDPARVDLKVRRGRTQLWRLHNASPITHYIHIHEEQWHTVSRDGKKPPAWERGLEDTWRLDPGETVLVAAKFTDYAGVFMIHCHMLDHEDHGMMAQWAVVRKGGALPKGYRYDRSASAAVTARAAVARLASAVGSAFVARPATGAIAAAASDPRLRCDTNEPAEAAAPREA